MPKQKRNYQSTLDDLYDWVSEAAHQDVLTLMDIIEKAKAYLHAAEELSADEIHTLENYLLRDFTTFSQQWKQEAEASLWLKNAKNRLWKLLSDMSDQNRLEMIEMEMDVAHQGLYQAGELVAVGKLICTQCGHEHDVEFVEEIQPCIECSGQIFVRAPQSH